MSVKYPVFTELIETPLVTACGEGVILRSDFFKTEKLEGIDDDAYATGVVPAGYMIKNIIIKNTTSNAVAIKIGTTDGGEEIMKATSIGGTVLYTYTGMQMLSLTVDSTIYITSADWNSAEVDIYVVMERLIYGDSFSGLVIST